MSLNSHKKALKVKKLLSSFALCAVAGAAQAGVVSGSGVLVNQDVDWYSFSTTSAGLVTIRATETVDDNSDFDPVLFLFRDDGVLTTDDFIEYNDDSGGGPSGLESLINRNLAAGNFLVAVATHGAWYNPLPIQGGHHVGTDYNLVVRGDFVTGNAVPEPSSWALVGLGLLGASLARKRKAA